MAPAAAGPSPDAPGRILRAFGVAYQSIDFIGAGATSEAWAITTGCGRLVLRIAAPRAGERACYEAEFGLRQRVLAQGGRVARPIATNLDVDARVAVEWCLDEFVEGAVAGGELPLTACHDLGETLAVLHGLPAEGHGQLQNRRDELVGKSASPVEGVLARLERPWPFTGAPLTDHPIAAEAPYLLSRLETLKPELLALLGDDRGRAVNHTDLHGGQLPVSDGRLAAILDFGDAVVAPPAWDIGSFGYFNGWDLTKRVLEGYTPDSSRRAELLEQGRLFAIVIALHHAMRSVSLNQPERMAGAIRYLNSNL